MVVVINKRNKRVKRITDIKFQIVQNKGKKNSLPI